MIIHKFHKKIGYQTDWSFIVIIDDVYDLVSVNASIMLIILKSIIMYK